MPLPASHRRARSRILSLLLAVLSAGAPACSKDAAPSPPVGKETANGTGVPAAAAGTGAQESAGGQTRAGSPAETGAPSAAGGWQEGPAALDRALAARTPVLLYMSSEWCPPCRALEANLLSKPAFQDAARGLALVRIDGDAEGAQAVAERFEAQAYPTLVLLSPDGDELFRAHHAVSLGEIAPALAAAAAAGSGFKGAIARLAAAGATAPDCDLLAAVDWGPASGMALSMPERLASLRRAFEQCPAKKGATRAPLAAHLLGLAATADTAAGSVSPAADIAPMADTLLDAVLQDGESAWAARTLVTTWVTPVVSWVLGAERGPRFAALRERWLRAASALRARPDVPVDVWLLTFNPAVDFHALESRNTPVSAALRDEIVAAVARADALAKTPAERHALASNAAYLLRAAGKAEEARAFLLREIAKSPEPSHYQTLLSQWALADGNRDDARRFARDAVTSARGRASRLQWLVNELSLYASDPADSAALLDRAPFAYALLFERDDAFLGRNRTRAARLAELLAPHRDAPAVRALVEKYLPRCRSLPEESRAHCLAHIATVQTGKP